MNFPRATWDRASSLIDRFGETAWFEASARADARMAKGDTAGERHWTNVLRAVKWLQDRSGRDPFKVEH